MFKFAKTLEANHDRKNKYLQHLSVAIKICYLLACYRAIVRLKQV